MGAIPINHHFITRFMIDMHRKIMLFNVITIVFVKEAILVKRTLD